ncbi:hypothetical protein RHIZ404_200435 [Rhizobium sp. EC-SD404]|nr:hypothetical protein RHIZ404_200435 [Rhizobium sp. EC-SD404]
MVLYDPTRYAFAQPLLRRHPETGDGPVWGALNGSIVPC